MRKSTAPRRRLGRKLKRLRERAGLTQRDIADALRYNTPQFISNFERGLSFLPDAVIPKFAKLVDRPAVEIIGIVYMARVTELTITRQKLMRRSMA